MKSTNRKAYNHTNYLLHATERKLTHDQYVKDHKIEIAIYQKMYHAKWMKTKAHRAMTKQHMAKYLQSNPEVLQWYYETHREEIKLKKHVYYVLNRQRILRKNEARRQRNK